MQTTLGLRTSHIRALAWIASRAASRSGANVTRQDVLRHLIRTAPINLPADSIAAERVVIKRLPGTRGSIQPVKVFALALSPDEAEVLDRLGRLFPTRAHRTNRSAAACALVHAVVQRTPALRAELAADGFDESMAYRR